MNRATKRARSLLTVLALGLTSVVATRPATAEIIVLDHFDDGVLDPEWAVTLHDANGWSYTEAGTELRVTDIDPQVVNPGGGGTWARVTLTREHAALDDLHADFDVSWDCEGSVAAQQYVFLSLLGTDGATVAAAGYGDAWVGGRGCRYVRIGAATDCQFNELPFTDSASIDIDRVGDQISILWDGVMLSVGDVATPVEAVQIDLRYYAQSGASTSFFGSEAVDLVSIEGTLTPTRASTWSRIKSRF